MGHLRANTINYVDRAVLNVLAPLVRQKTGTREVVDILMIDDP